MNDNPFAPPQAESEQPAASGPMVDRVGDAGRIEHGALVLPTVASLPSRCVQCGCTSDLEEHVVSFTWHPLFAKLSIVLGVLIGLLVMMVTRQTSVLTFSLCTEHARVVAWRRRMAIVVLLGGPCAWGLALVVAQASSTLALLLFAGGLVAFFASAIALGRLHPVRAQRIQRHEASYVGIHSDVLHAVVPSDS